jgi:DNA-binding protein YbaB
MIACEISGEAMNDREMLQDLVRSATNAALDKMRQQSAAEANKMAGNLGLPPGMGLPGMP